MVWYAIDAIQDAIDETKALLWPFERGIWLRLAVIVFFVGGPGGAFGSGLQNASRGFGRGFGQGVDDGGAGAGAGAGTGAGTGAGNVSGNASMADLAEAFGDVTSGPGFPETLVAVAAILLGLILLLSYLSAVFEFVFYRGLVDEEIRLREPFRRYAWDGVKYALFRFGLLLAVFGTVGGAIAAMVLDLGVGLALVFPAILVWLVLAMVGFFVHALAIPTMVVEETGFVEALRRTWRRVRTEWKQAGVYLLASIAVGIAASILVGIGILVGVIGLAIPLVILALGLMAVAEVLVAIPILLGVVGLIAIYFAIAIPVQTYVYRWMLDVHAGFADAA